MMRLLNAILFLVIAYASAGLSPVSAAQLDAEYGLLLYVDYDTGNRLMIESTIVEGPTSGKLMLRTAPLSVSNVLEPGWEEQTATRRLDDSCRLFTGDFLEADGFLTPTWLTTCYTSSVFFLVFSDRSESLAIQVSNSILQDGEPDIPINYTQIPLSEREIADLMAEPTAVISADSTSEKKVTRTTRPSKDSTTTYTEGDWYYESADGNSLEISITEIESDQEALRILNEYDPEQQSIEIGIPLIGEGKNAPEGCRQFTFSSGENPDYILLCSYTNFGLFVVGSDYRDVMKVAEAFSSGEKDFVPSGYKLVD